MMQNNKIVPLVSIVLPVYNGETYLESSIQSCLEQTHDNLELIIVDDGSQDNSLQIANRFASQDNRVIVISNEINKQLPASLNIGHRAAKGDLITWTSHDNYFEPNAIKVLVEEILTSCADIVFSDVRIIESSGKFRKVLNMQDASLLLFNNSIGSSFLYRKEVFLRNCGYNENLHTVEDYDFWLRATIHSTFHHIEKVLYNFRSHQHSLSSKLKVPESPENRLFEKRLKQCYLNFLQLLKCKEIEFYAEVLSQFHQFKKVDIALLLKRYSGFENFLQETANQTVFLNFEKMHELLNLRIRFNISEFPENQSPKILWLVIRKQPSILYKYDRRNSLEIFRKCLSVLN